MVKQNKDEIVDLISKMHSELKYYHDLYWMNLGDNNKLTEHVKRLKPATCRGCEILKESEMFLKNFK